jgi:hypothetical protein
MDHRIALKSNTPLRLCNKRGEVIHCIIESEIGRGGSCIVYEASRVTDTGDKTLYRVKEFYPYKLNISRNEDNGLIPSTKDAEDFNQGQEQLRSDFSRTNQLFYSDSNYSSMTNQLDVFSQNGTSYILSAYSSKKTLATYRPESLKECIMIIKQVAYVINKIHQQGYLYLDTKPDNILVVEGYQKQVQLFDFDSLLAIQDMKKTSRMNCSSIRLSYSKGFAPIELQTSNIKRLGSHTDVYGVGALMFYLLFGCTPNAPDCEMDAEYDFSGIQYDYNKCDDRLFGSLRDFFHNTLAVYYADRYQSMQDVVEQLQDIEKYADLLIPRIYSTQIVKPKIFYGRECEFGELDKLLAGTDYNCLFVTGMGGIGKSAFIREYLISRRKKYDTVLYVHYKGSIEATISNDSNIEINTLRQEEEVRTGTRYFDKKLQKIRELVRGTSSILVIDNFTGVVDDDLMALLGTELKIILLSRKAPSYKSCHEMKLSAVSDPVALRHIFEDNLGRSIADNEQDGFEQILQRVERHTLVLELIAKQIANSHITISSAALLTNEYGFSAIAPEKVDYEKDSKPSNDTIGNIIDALFEKNVLSENKKALMKVASLLGDDGMDINQFQQIMELASKDDLNELIKDGWLTTSGHVISMHRVIQEAVRRWKWKPSYLDAAEQFLTYFYLEIYLESTKNNYPKKLCKHLTTGKDESARLLVLQLMQPVLDRKGLAGKVTQERYARAEDDSPADFKKLEILLLQAENIIKQCQRESELYDSNLFDNLLYIVLLNMPRYREDFIFSEASQILTERARAFEVNDYAKRDSDFKKDAVAFMRLYQLVFSIYAAHSNVKAMEELLDSAYRATRYFRKREACAIYYCILSEYYETLLNGAYDSRNHSEELLLNKILDAIDKSLHYSKRGLNRDGNHIYIKNLLGKATILLRSGRGSGKDVCALIETAKKLIVENTMQYADVRLDYYMVCGWYYGLIHGSDATVADCFKNADDLAEKIIPTDMEKIDRIIIPCANVFFELGNYKNALELLFKGTRFCHVHPAFESYARKKQELCDHIWEVGIEAQSYDWCLNIIKLIEAENNEIDDPQKRVIIPDEIRNIIASKSI